MLTIILKWLRANVCNFRESVDSREFLNFFIPDFKSLSHDTLISLLMNYSDYLRATPFKYRPKYSKAQKIKIALLLHSDRLK